MDDFLERRRLPIIVFLLIVIAIGLVVIYVRWPRTPAGLGSLRAPQGAAAVTTIERGVTVHVAGAVRQPGVYTLRDGQRVQDAIAAAGGATDDADLSGLNLAQRLRDEGYILVPGKSDTPVPAAGASPAAGKPLNINSATRAQLEALPGIGATYAQRIIDYRTQNGPFQKTDDLLTFKLIPRSTYDKLKDLIDIK